MKTHYLLSKRRSTMCPRGMTLGNLISALNPALGEA
jgi:hypothetical protein